MYKLLVNTETFGFFRTFLPYFFGRKGAFFVILHNFSENVRLYASSPYSAKRFQTPHFPIFQTRSLNEKIRTST